MCLLAVFEIKREAILIALKTSRSRQSIMSQNSFDPTENRSNRFEKVVMKCDNQPVENSF